MIIDSRQKRNRLGYQRFLLSILCTLFFLSLYLLGLYYIPAPELCLGQLGSIQERRLLSQVLDYQIQVNFVISVLSTFFAVVASILWKKQEIEERQNLESVRSALSKFLKPNFIAFIGIFNCWNLIKSSPYLVSLTYLSFFVSNSVFELIVGSLNDYGVCRGFELIFFVDKFPFKLTQELFFSLLKTILFVGSRSDLRKAFLLLSILIIVYFFVSLLGKKWEIPINTDRVGFSENHINYSPTFFLQMNFSIFPLIFVSSLIKICGVFWNLLLKGLKESSGFSFTREFFTLWEDFSKFSMNSSSFKEVFFAVNSATNPFSDFYQKGKENSNFFPAITCWILTIHFINWLIVSNSQLNCREISERLAKSGAYLDSIRPGEETEKLVGRVVNVLVALWAFHLTLLTICFDNAIFSLVSNSLEVESRLGYYNRFSFLRLLTTVSAAIDLSKQVKKKYDYSKFYD